MQYTLVDPYTCESWSSGLKIKEPWETNYENSLQDNLMNLVMNKSKYRQHVKTNYEAMEWTSYVHQQSLTANTNFNLY